MHHGKKLKRMMYGKARVYTDYHGYAWYRIHIVIPSSLKKEGVWKDSLRIFLAHVNDVDETFLNGKKFGKTGSFPSDKSGYVSKWPAIRTYNIFAGDGAIHWDA
jgi:alpha-galactosidase